MLLLLFNQPQPAQSSANRGQVRVRIGTDWVIKPVKIWNGSAWVQKPVRYWNGSAWVFTFGNATGYTLTQDSSDSGFFTGNGAKESSSDVGFYDIQGSAAKEDSSDSGFYTIS